MDSQTIRHAKVIRRNRGGADSGSGEKSVIPFCLVKIRRDSELRYTAFSPMHDREVEIDCKGIGILRHCDGVQELAEIAAIVAREMPMETEVSIGSITAFLEEMSGLGIIAWRQEPSHKRKLPAPKSVFWDITGKCNLRCAHCYNSDKETSNRQEVSFDVARRVLNEMRAFGVENIIFTGGEPFLREDFTEILVYAAELKFPYVSVATNGTLLRRETALRLKHPNLYVQVSIDGDRPEVHDRMRGVKGSFEKAMQAITMLQEEGVQVKSNTTVTNLNIDAVPGIIELMGTLKVTCRFQGMVPIGRGRTNAKEIMLSPARMKSVSEYLVRMNLDPGGLSFTLKPAPEETIDFNGSGACSAGYTTCAITAAGAVVPCTFFWGMAGANVRHLSFLWIWENSQLLNYFRDIKLGEIKGHCRECKWFMRCRGGCRAECYMGGDLFGSNSNCWVSQEIVPVDGNL
jgi:radical SAM protein with 4Fe4S-binding SPASM domain